MVVLFSDSAHIFYSVFPVSSFSLVFILGQPSMPVFNRVGLSQLWLFSQIRSYKKNYFSSSFQKNIFFWKFLPLFFSYGMFMHRVNIYKSSYFFFNRRLAYIKKKKNYNYIYKKIFFKFLYRNSHKVRYGKYEFYDNEQTYQFAPLYYRAPFFKSMYFSKLWIFKLSDYIFLKMHLLISDALTYDGKKWIKKSRRMQKLTPRFKSYKKLLSKVPTKLRRKTYPAVEQKIRNKQNYTFKYFFLRSKYIFKILNNKLDNSNYYWF